MNVPDMASSALGRTQDTSQLHFLPRLHVSILDIGKETALIMSRAILASVARLTIILVETTRESRICDLIELY